MTGCRDKHTIHGNGWTISRIMWSIPSGLLVHGRWLGLEGILWWVQLHICHIVCCWCVVTKSCLTLCNPMDCSPPGSSVHGISQAWILEWVAIPFSRDLPNSGIKPTSPASPALAGGFFTTAPPVMYWVLGNLSKTHFNQEYLLGGCVWPTS